MISDLLWTAALGGATLVSFLTAAVLVTIWVKLLRGV